MSSTEGNLKTLREVYRALERKDYGAVFAHWADELSFHIVRSLPMQTHAGKGEVVAYLNRVSDVSPLDGEIELEHMGGDDEYVFSLHVEARGTPREHRHVMVWRMGEGKIREAWELTLGGPPSLHGVNIEALEQAGYTALVMEP